MIPPPNLRPMKDFNPAEPAILQGGFDHHPGVQDEI
jgi:hypothetical protein